VRYYRLHRPFPFTGPLVVTMPAGYPTPGGIGRGGMGLLAIDAIQGAVCRLRFRHKEAPGWRVVVVERGRWNVQILETEDGPDKAWAEARATTIVERIRSESRLK
jgi:hypothetical protein